MSTNDMSTLQAWFKTAYADHVRDLVPDCVYYAKEARALPSEQQPGGTYTLPVTLTSEQGVTLAAASAGAFALNSPIAMATQNSTVNGAQFLLRSGIDYESIFRSKNKNSFIRATKGVIKNMLKSAYFYMEAELMWGKAGLGTVASISTNTITLTTAEFAPGLWLGSENRKLRIESSAGVLRGTCSVSSYDIGARTITVDSAPAGVAATDVIYFESAGASGANEMQGLYGVVQDTSGTIFGISGSSYDLWAPSTAFSAGSAPLTFNKIILAVANASNKGLGDEIREIDCVVNPLTFGNLINDIAAARQYDASYDKGEAVNGAEKITFHSPAGVISVLPHKCMKEGYAFIHPKASRSLVKVGSQPVPTFELPGMVSAGEKQYLRTMENNAGQHEELGRLAA